VVGEREREVTSNIFLSAYAVGLRRKDY